jgi:ethanolamine transporter EutH
MSTRDIIAIPLVFGLIMIPTYIAYTILDEVNTALTSHTVDDRYFADGIAALEVFNAMIIAAVVFIGIAAIALASQIRTHPSFSLISLFLLTIFVCISAWLANAYYEFQQASQFSVAANALDNFVIINNNLPIIVAVLGIMVIIALYAKPWERGGATSL